MDLSCFYSTFASAFSLTPYFSDILLDISSLLSNFLFSPAMPSSSVKKILILAANPLDDELPRLRLDEEVKQIRTSLQLAENRNSFEIEAYGSVRPEELQQYLYDIKPQIVHFSGHGIGKQGLAFEDEDGGVKLVSSETLGNLFRLFAKEIECVVLNACYAEVQA
jgi:CHAT domain-containing protein